MSPNPHPDLGQSAFSAFRSDLAASNGATTPTDDRLLAVATLLRHSTIDPASGPGSRALAEAREVATGLSRPAQRDRALRLDEPGTGSELDVFRATADLAGDLGRTHLQLHMLDSIATLAGADVLTRGRAQLRRVGVLIHMGELEQAEAWLDARLETELAEHRELLLRALILHSAIQRSRGNVPAARELFERILTIAGDGFVNVRALSLVAMGTLLAMSGKFAEALDYCWRGYGVVAGSGTSTEIDALADLALVLMNSGWVAEARAVLGNLLHRAESEILYVILSGYAEASGLLGDRAGVEWATDQLLEMERRRFYPRFVAQSLIECAFALDAVGDRERATTLFHRTLELANKYQFHDLVFRAENAPPPAPPKAVLDARGAEIARQARALEPASRPVTLAYAD